MVKITEQCPDTSFDWSLYEDGWKGGNHLLANKRIKTKNSKDVVYSREAYAYEPKTLEMYGSTISSYSHFGKDLKKGDVVSADKIKRHSGSVVAVEINGMDVIVDMEKERKLLHALGYNDASVINNTEAFIRDMEHIASVTGVEHPLALVSHRANIGAKVLEGGSNPRISLWDGMVAIHRAKMIAEAKQATTCYMATIEDANKGGYFVSVNGVKAFLPGSLAAANKIANFQSMIGKTVMVMVEDYLADIDSIIVSHKKYISHILPEKLATLEIGKEYTGIVTGTTKFGVFIEFEELCTGLLHNSKIRECNRQNFASVMRIGDTVKFYIEEIKDNRIILTEYNPQETLDLLTGYAEQIKDKEVVVTVSSIKPSKGGRTGVTVQVQIDGFVGYMTDDSIFMLKKESKIKLIQGDSIRVVLDRLEDRKLYFEIPSLH